MRSVLTAEKHLVLLCVHWFSQRTESVHEPVCAVFQKHSPRTERSQSWHANQKECPDRHVTNAEPKPDDIGLVNEVQPIRIESDEAEQFGRLFKYRNDSSNADDFEHATCAGGKIDENVIVEAVVELQRCRVEDQSKN